MHFVGNTLEQDIELDKWAKKAAKEAEKSTREYFKYIDSIGEKNG